MNRLYFGDCLDVLRNEIADESVDLVYLDPPFNSSRNYNLLFKAPSGHQSEAQISAFEDTWHWGEQAELEFREILSHRNTQAAEIACAFRKFLDENDLMAYLVMMTSRLLEMHRVLRQNGSLYLHCDPSASHYLKIILDAVFGQSSYRNEIIWKRTTSHSSAKRWGDIHDSILFYSKSEAYTWNCVPQPYEQAYLDRFKRKDQSGNLWSDDNLTAPGVRHGDSGMPWRGIDPTTMGCHWKVNLATVVDIVGIDRAKKLSTTAKLELLDEHGFIYWPRQRSGEGIGFPRFKRYLGAGSAVQDMVLDIPPLNSQAADRMGFPTQKPIALLERIIESSSNPDDTVLDPFCGCGTAVHAAQKLGRQWIGIDITHLAITLIEKRLHDAFPNIEYEVHGTPKDLDGARNLAIRDKYQFQWWACSLVGAQPWQDKKKGADRGIDGIIYFQDEKGIPKKIIVSVKGGETVGRAMIADLKNSVEREKAQIGLFVTLAAPTREMLKEALTAGFYESPNFKSAEFPKIQILTIEGLMNGTQRPRFPDLSQGAYTFKRAAQELEAAQDASDLFGISRDSADY
jgi:DNA modification methylase